MAEQTKQNWSPIDWFPAIQTAFSHEIFRRATFTSGRQDKVSSYMGFILCLNAKMFQFNTFVSRGHAFWRATLDENNASCK